MGQQVIGVPNPSKIDDEAALGLLGKENSLSYGIDVIETHIHARERWFGLAAVPDGESHRADLDSMTPFQINGGNDTWGAWVQIIGTEDTPTVPGLVSFDPRQLLITEVQTGKIKTRIQFAFGDDTANNALSIGSYTEEMMVPEKTTKESPFDIHFPRLDAGTKVWSRVWGSDQASHTFDFFLGFHQYIG